MFFNLFIHSSIYSSIPLFIHPFLYLALPQSTIFLPLWSIAAVYILTHTPAFFKALFSPGGTARKEVAGSKTCLFSIKRYGHFRHLGGSAVEHLPSAQVVISGSWNEPHIGFPAERRVCFSLCSSLHSCALSQIILKKKKRYRHSNCENVDFYQKYFRKFLHVHLYL